MSLKPTVKTSILLIILLSNFFLISIPLVNGVSQYDSEIYVKDYIEQAQSNYYNYNQESDNFETKIVLYDSFADRNAALEKLDDESIKYVFYAIPAVTLEKLTRFEIPTNGLISVIEDRVVITKESIVAETKLSDNFEGNTLRESAKIINIDKLRDMELTGEGIKIAIIDGGVAYDAVAFLDENGNSRVETHDVKGIKKNAAEFIDEHGSHVAGIAAGNGKYLIDGVIEDTDSPGMAPNAQILSIRVLDENGTGLNSWILEGIDFAIKSDADVISMSLSSNLYEGEADLHRILLETAASNGTIVVAAAGNQGPIGSGVGIPGGLESVIGVGAAALVDGEINSVWKSSSIGPSVNNYVGADLIAPGNVILSVNYTDGSVLSLTGTSMATPHVSGGILLLKEAFPLATVSQIREALLASAKDVNLIVEVQGRGLVDFAKAYDFLESIINYDTAYVPVLPNRISDENYFFRNRISGITKTFPIFVHSHKNVKMIPHVDTNVTQGVSFDFPDEINVVNGYNKFTLGVTVTTNMIEDINGTVYFTDSKGIIFTNSNITYSSTTRFAQGNILFDTSHDADTPSGYFANHGPRGQFSIMAKVLEEEGFVVTEHQSGLITSLVLDSVDVLVIADPDVVFQASEITAIQEFIKIDGKSLFIIANGGFMKAEEYEYDDFNLNDLNAILDGTGLSIHSNNSIYACTRSEVPSRYVNCPRDATTGFSQNVLNSGIVFPSYGPTLTIEDVSDVSNFAVAYQNKDKTDHIVVAASELDSYGRVIVFSSSLLFDNIGTTTDYVGGGSDVNNRQIIRDTFYWLLDPRNLDVTYTFNDNQAGRYHRVDMYTDFIIEIAVTNPKGEKVNYGANLNAVVYFDPLNDSAPRSFNISFTRNDDNTYSTDYSFDQYGIYEIFYHAELDGYIPSAGHISVLATLHYQDQQEAIQKISQLLLLLLMVSWIFWLRNEGGWKFKKKKQENK